MATSLIIPGSNSGARDVDARVDVIRSQSAWSGKYGSLAGLPSPIELGNQPWDISDEIKWLMLRDSQVFAGYMLWKTGILVDGIQVYPTDNVKSGERRYKLAQEISEFCLWNFNQVQGGFHNKLLQLLDCCIWGHKAGVQIYRKEKFGRWKDKAVLDRLRVMPNDSYRIRVNDFGDVIGLQPTTESGNDKIYNINKFAYTCFRPIDDHPFGTHLLWPVYGAWYEKMQIAPERLANMAQFGSPSLWASAPEGIKEIEMVGADGLPMRYPLTLSDGVTPHPKAGQAVTVPINRHMMDALQNFQGNGSVTVVPHSAIINKLEAANGGEVFRFYSDDKNLEIIKGMFFTTGWTEQEKYGSNAKGKVSASIGQFSLVDGKNMLADVVEEKLCRNLVIMNYGEENADLVPRVTFGNIESGILASLYNAIAALWSTGFFDDTQRAALCRKMSLPEPDPNATRPPRGEPTGNVLVNNKDKNASDQNASDQNSADNAGNGENN